jgi:signal transduction histidine kinase
VVARSRTGCDTAHITDRPSRTSFSDRVRGRLRRLPIRVKLALAFAGVMAVVLAGLGAFLYSDFKSGLDDSLNGALRAQATSLSAVVKQDGVQALQDQPPRFTSRVTGFAQLIDGRTGRVLTSTENVRGTRIATPNEIAEAHGGVDLMTQHRGLPNVGKSNRILVQAVPGTPYVVAVGRPLRDRQRVINLFLAGLFVGIPLCLLIASFCGYLVAALALRPVDRMRERAELLSTAEPGARLPVPETRDEIAALGESLNAMIGRLERAFTDERAVNTSARSELGPPLALLKTQLDDALRKDVPPEELEAALRVAAEETDRLSRLADDLLTVTRADQGRMPVRAHPVDLSDVVAHAAERVRPRMSDAGRPLEAVRQQGRIADADPVWVAQAIDNLLDNAFQYGAGRVRVFTQARGDELVIHVTDEGPGFPDDFLPRAFDRFTRADPHTGRGGAGFGLAIVDAVAHAHGGRAGAGNSPLGGADVWFTVPVAPEGAEPIDVTHRGDAGQVRRL